MVLRIHLLYGWIDKTRLNKITVFSLFGIRLGPQQSQQYLICGRHY